VILRCERCGARIRAVNIDVHQRVARCRRCKNVFGFRVAATSSESSHEGAPLPLPEGWRLSQNAYSRTPSGGIEPEATLSWSWFLGTIPAVFVFFTLGWNGLLLYWLSCGEEPLVVQHFPFFHIGVGLLLGYVSLLLLFNRTQIVIRDGWIRVSHGPLPALRSLSIRHSSVQQLYCQKTCTPSNPPSSSKCGQCW